MSASQIPDLRTLRYQRPPRRGRASASGAARGGSSTPFGRGSRLPPSARNPDDPFGHVPGGIEDDPGETRDASIKDQIVQGTDLDASLSRVSAVELGYLDDPFASLFLEGTEKTERRFPIINRGTYVRTYAIDLLVQKFLKDEDVDTPPSSEYKRKKQIISLGAGSDTRWFRLVARSPSMAQSLVHHELDFSSNTARKIASIQQSETLLSLIRSSQQSTDGHDDLQILENNTRLLSGAYNIHPVDLRSLHHGPSPHPRPEDVSSDQGNTHSPRDPSTHPFPHFDPTLPTLFISECCLVYLSPFEADNVLKYFTSPSLFPESTPLGIILYEPIRPRDAFGQVMVKNLARRGIVLQTLQRYGTLRRQRERLRLMGFRTGQGAADVDFVHEQWIDEDERRRVAALEMLDEVEEWRLLARHYCVAWAWRDSSPEGRDADANENEDEGMLPFRDVFAPWRESIPLQPPEDDDDNDGYDVR